MIGSGTGSSAPLRGISGVLRDSSVHADEMDDDDLWAAQQRQGPSTWEKAKVLGQNAGMGFGMGLFVGGTVGFMSVLMSGRGLTGVGKVMLQSGLPFGTIFAVGSCIRVM
jgi:hypothetical protein